MEQEKLLDELENVREEIRGLKKILRQKRQETNLLSLVFFLVPFGVAVTLYSSNILNEALNFKAPIWYGYLGVIVGIFCMVTPLLPLSSIMSKNKKSRSRLRGSFRNREGRGIP